ncbi:MAG: galactokinase family protein [Eubacteriales bacterium]|jgi:N-acetylgalactosamine kinase|nr:galactokinase family protein [Eubacteriales bacterium]
MDLCKNSKNINSNTAGIILCAGSGTRMNDDSTNKVCFPCNGIPVIIRIINNMKSAGIDRFVIVVGHHAQKVMECLSGIDNIVYAFQPVQNGTGGAALCGLMALDMLGFGGTAVVAMGDKITSPDVFRELIAKKGGNEVVWGVQTRELNENGGRIVMRGNKIYAVVEKPDSALLALGAVAEKSRSAYEEALAGFGLNEKKKSKVIEKALDTDDLPVTKQLNGEDFTSAEIERSLYTNGGLYCFDVKPAIEAIKTIKTDNAQGEIYLTDALEYLTERGTVDLMAVTRREQMLTYSTKEELAELDCYFAQADMGLRPASYWINAITNRTDEIQDKFREIYGDDQAQLSERGDTYVKLLNAFIDRYGDKDIVITRAPGRINLMGRHIDHRGGGVNMMVINRETLLIASARQDDTVNISNLDKSYRDYSFSISKCIGEYTCHPDNGRDEWLSFIECERISESVKKKKGQWVNYVKSAVLRHQFSSEKPLVGMDIMLTGNIPVAAGLSSSSSIVVAISEAIAFLNNLDITEKRFIDMCGEGEWFVGSRGGAGDHAAMKSCSRGMITHLGFLPFTVGGSVPFSSDYKVIVANSFIEAKKSEGAKEIYNQRVSAYEFGLMLIQRQYPEITVFRDLAKLPDREIYRLLLDLPERITSHELKTLLPDKIDKIEQIQNSHFIPDTYLLRSVILYGIAECRRSEECHEALRDGDYELLGKLMNISHDGDRVWRNGVKYDYSAGDSYIQGLYDNNAPLFEQPGGYACSTIEIDNLVDMAISRPGVMGAELVGAGLGGCIIILVKKEFADQTLEFLKENYYNKNGYPMGAQVYSASSRSSRLY